MIMAYRLRTYDESPPGLYRFAATEGGIKLTAGPSPMIEAAARELANKRAANGLPRSGIKDALVDIDRYTCARLGNMPRYCIQVDGENMAPALSSASPIITPCSGCGAKVH